MAMVKGLAAAALLVLSMSAAAACDDFDDEMALAAAMRAAKLARSSVPEPAPSADIVAPARTLSGTDVATVATRPGEPQANEPAAGTLHR